MREQSRQAGGHDAPQDGDGPIGIDRSIRPDAPVPATVLVAVMSDGSYLLVGYPPGGPSAYLVAEDAVTLGGALAAAFGGQEQAGDGTPSGGGHQRGPATQT